MTKLNSNSKLLFFFFKLEAQDTSRTDPQIPLIILFLTGLDKTKHSNFYSAPIILKTSEIIFHLIQALSHPSYCPLRTLSPLHLHPCHIAY